MTGERHPNGAWFTLILVATGLLTMPLPAVGSQSVLQPVADWHQTGKLTPSDAASPTSTGPSHAGVAFGSALASDGDLLVASTTFDGGERQDWVYVFEQGASGLWVQDEKLVKPGGSNTGGGFGKSVDVDASSGVIVVGNPGYDAQQEDTGRVHVFEETSQGNWTEAARLEYSGPDTPRPPGANFGDAVVVDGDTIVVGAPRVSADGLPVVGAAYVFDRGLDGTWTHEATLRPSQLAPYSVFGAALALDDGTLAVGASNADEVTIFEPREDDWVQSTVLEPRPAPHLDSAYVSCFGFSLDIDGQTLVVGEPCRTTPEEQLAGLPWSGAANVFEHTSQGDWNHVSQLTSGDPAPGEDFGKSVAVLGDLIVVGAPHGPGYLTHQGEISIFHGEGETWEREALLQSNETSRGDEFGYAVAVIGSSVAAGSPFDDNRRDDAPAPLKDEGDVPPCLGGPLDGVKWGCDEGEDAGSVFLFSRGDQGVANPTLQSTGWRTPSSGGIMS